MVGRTRLQDSKKRNKRSAAAKLRREKENLKHFCRSLVESIVDESVRKSSTWSSTSSNNQDDILSTPPRRSSENINTKDEYDFTWGSLEEYEATNQTKLEVEHEDIKYDGNRIVNIHYLMNQAIQLQYRHSKKCTAGTLMFEKEIRKGLVSTLVYKCNGCSEKVSVCTENTAKPILNKATVWGTLATGSTYEHTAEFLSILDIPCLSKNMFFEVQQSLGPVWKECLWEAMEKAGQEEYEIAVAKGKVDENGVGRASVLADGGWSKRSYGHTYDALSGVAAIIGKETGKLLFLGVKNKYCSICAKAESQNKTVKEHLCYKNWSKSSSAMEPAIIVEGFNSSIAMHKLKYTTLIADGDSTVYSEIRKNVTYGSEVEKVECMNHCLKNYSKALYKVKGDTKNVSLECRKFLSTFVIKQLVTGAQSAIYANAHGDPGLLKRDLRNSVNHVFGNHELCQHYLCDKTGDKSCDKTLDLRNTGAHHHIYAALNLLLIKSHLLIDKETSNRAELYMSLLARFNMGKRLNLIQRGSFEIRSFLTGLKYNERHSWHSKAWKKTFNCSPGKNLKKFMTQRDANASKRKRDSTEKPKIAKKLKYEEGKTLKKSEKRAKEYGPNIAEVIVDDETLEKEVNHLIQRLQVTSEERSEICEATVGQFNNLRYLNERKNRLTASKFGAVVKRRATTSCNVLVKSILSVSSLNTSAVQYGRINECVAIQKFEELTGKTVHPSGLFIDETYGFLGASPDGIINDDEIVEVKCLFKVASTQENFKDAVKNKKVSYLEIKEDVISLKKSHDYYYQIQGQLAICKRKKCHFIVYSGNKNDLFIETISKDEIFWRETMLPKLIWFYKECLAPEIILNRRASNLPCREPVLKKAEKDT